MLKSRWWRWLLALVVLIVVGVLSYQQYDVLLGGLTHLRYAEPLPLALCLLTALLSLAAMAEVMRQLMAAGGSKVSPGETNAITFASNAWATTLPGGAAFSAILTYKVQRGWGASRALCAWFFVFSGLISTMWLVLLGISAVVFLGARISLASLIITLLVMVAVSFGLYVASRNPHPIARACRPLVRPIVKLFRKDPDKAAESIGGFINGLAAIQLTPGRFAKAAIFSLLNRGIDILSLWLCAWAITGTMPGIDRIPDHTTIAGVLLTYVTTKIAGSVQATPGGLGPVEAALVTTLVATGMTVVHATGTAVAYRLITLVLVNVVGWLIYVLHYLRRGVSAREGAADGEARNPREGAVPTAG